MLHRPCNLLLLALACAPLSALAKDKLPPDAFAVSLPAPPPAPPANGSIFQSGYVPLTSGGRAGQVGDIITIQLVERTTATKSTAAGTQRDGSVGLTPPSTGPLSLFDPSDIAMGGGQKFAGKGSASQSNALSGEVSVTIAEVYPNGTMLVKGEKLLTLNRGDERVQISGIVRAIDIGPDNRVLSTRVANANIRYTGKGEIARASKQGWLQRFFSIISPF
ncbi:flagellar basal body L-ring protein FlgH [Sphingopyxis sp. DHUNG17]|uniref:flagellar basal body L-ring protein FlgH n=1 Tax=Sphingopyxis jiangsuensis TaxID=2871171 RepID=UPI0019200206|nr:flagellar basal body L-ring protein FlgH [Sphingopyxis lutea]MBL0769616.1 flagellar basal body L-ring protein FlgH [Sphingopyxis lutea]